MNHLPQIQIIAQLMSIVIYGLLAIWFVAPWLNGLGRANALAVLAAMNVFRYVTLIMFSAQRDGYPISDIAALEAVVGDVLGALIAVLAIGALRFRWQLGVGLSWLLAGETAVDFAVGIRRKALEPLWGLANGTTWLLLNFYVPLLMVALPVLVWQLYRRRNEPLTTTP